MTWKMHFLIFIIYTSYVSSYHDTTIEDYDYTPEDDPELTKPLQKTKPRTERPLANYEVAENVEDIPNPNLINNRIVTNFTVSKPLNIVPVLNKTENNNQNVPNDAVNINDFLNIKDTETHDHNDDDYTEDVSIDSAIIPDFNESEDAGSHEDFDILNILPTLRAYLHGLKNGIISGLNGLVGRVYKGGKVNEPIREPTPVWINKLKRQGHDVKNTRTYYDYEFEDY